MKGQNIYHLKQLQALRMRAAYAEDLFALLQDPLRQHALHHLSAASLARLRSASRAARLLVDDHTGSTWKAAASVLVEDAILPSTEHSYAVQIKLRQQGALLHKFRTGEQLPSCSLLLQLEK